MLAWDRQLVLRLVSMNEPALVDTAVAVSQLVVTLQDHLPHLLAAIGEWSMTLYSAFLCTLLTL